MRIAGVYASAFLFELAEYFIFYFLNYCVCGNKKQNFLYMYRNEKQI